MKAAKYVVFSLIPLVVMLLSAEVALRIVYFQRHADRMFAGELGVQFLRDAFSRWRSQRAVEATLAGLGVSPGEELVPEEVRRTLHEALYADEGKEVLARFRREYEEHFARLAGQVQAAGARLLVLYLPSDDYEGRALYRRDPCRAFFGGLAGRYGADFLDLTDEALRHRVEDVTLLPENGHLSRFGNHLVADALQGYLEEHMAHRSSVSFPSRPPLLGDLKPGLDEIWTMAPAMPYRVVTNSQGFRMEYDLEFPKRKQRILCLGDSFTFGPYLDNHDCYPNVLDTRFPDREVINGGVAGYSLPDELGLFSERARYAEPDIVVLQVLDNDIYDLYYFQKNTYNRRRETFAPSEEEVKLFRELRARKSHNAREQ